MNLERQSNNWVAGTPHAQLVLTKPGKRARGSGVGVIDGVSVGAAVVGKGDSVGGIVAAANPRGVGVGSVSHAGRLSAPNKIKPMTIREYVFQWPFFFRSIFVQLGLGNRWSDCRMGLGHLNRIVFRQAREDLGLCITRDADLNLNLLWFSAAYRRHVML